ncbi:hypothetical protein V496_03404 [Pseudogymnoascus sp. VKM F-4515 (FW-2607)]|nr:hypothetical protein V496_03404 [Pseudogymnoascus sp. VKM F-4515 (FW-2607)]
MEVMSSRSPGPEQGLQNLPHICPTVEFISAVQTLSPPPGKRKFDVLKLELNANDATATATSEKIGLGLSMKESDSCSEVDLVLPERQVLPPNADRDVGKPSEEIKQSEGYTNGHPATFLKKPSFASLLDAVNTPSAAEPDFGVPDEHSVRVIVPRPAREMVVPRGPGRPPSTYTNRNKTVGSGPDRPQQSSSPVKAFDFSVHHSRQPSVDRGTEQAPKRRKIMVQSGSPDGSSDDILYEQTRNIAASSRPTKTVASGIPPLERKRPGYGINEFRGVEVIVSGGSRRRRRPDSQSSSNQSSREATIDKDEIQDSDLDIAKPPLPYKGTANLAPARTKEERDAQNNSVRRVGPSAFANREAQAGRKLHMADDSTSSRVRKPRIDNRGPGTNYENISDDELSLVQPKPGPKKVDTGTVMSHFVRSPTSGSMSREGDIRSSLPRQSQRKTMGRAGKSSLGERPRFIVTYLRTAAEIGTPLIGAEPYYLQYNLRTSLVEFTTDDQNHPVDDTHPSVAFNPTSVTKIVYSDENGKMVLWVTEIDSMTGNLPKLLLTVDKGSLYNFVRFLQSKSNADVKVQHGDTLDKMFTQVGNNFQEWRRRRHSAEDVELLKQRRNQRHVERSQHQASGAGLTSDGKRPGNFDSSMEPPRNKKMHERLQNGSSDGEISKPEGNPIETKRGIERSKESGDESQSRQFGRNGNSNDNRPTTRSTRGQNREILIRSPSPPRYTSEHRDWQKYWAGVDEPLIFPLEGTNKAQVDMRDIERLDEGVYLNDNLIAFYLRYLQEKTERDRPDVFKRVFFMNTYFYPRLTKGKGRKNIDYDAVKRWTSKVNIFDYDYIVVPVNENTHWYLAIICNVPKLLPSLEEKISKEDEQAHEKGVVELGEAGDTRDPAHPTSKNKEESMTPEVARKVSRLSIEDRGSPKLQPNGKSHIDVEGINPGTPNHISTVDDDTDRPQKETSSVGKGRKGKRKSIPPVRRYNTEEPRIITLDSIGSPHSPTCSNLRDFLIAEAKEKLDIEITLENPSLGMTAKNIPEQQNWCDCGLFLLGYVEGFLDHPEETMHGIMQGRTDMASSFPKMNASEMRNNMRDLIFRLRREQYAKQHEAKKSKKAFKEGGKEKEGQPTRESKNVSSASTSPKPPVPPKPEIKAAEGPASASETKEAPKPREEAPKPREEAQKPREEVVNVIEEEQPKKESPSTPEESATVESILDNLFGFEENTTEDKETTEPSPLTTSPPLEEITEKADRRAIIDETSSRKTSTTQSKYFVKIKGQQPKFPSPDRNRQRKDVGEANVVAQPSTPPPRQPRQQLRSSPRNQVDISSGSSEDSLRVGMSPDLRGRKGAPRNLITDLIPDSQGDDTERGGGRTVDGGRLVEDLTTETTPRRRAGEAALKRQKDTTEGQKKKKSGAGALFGSAREKGREKNPVELE